MAFNLEKWEAQLPKGKNIETTKVTGANGFHSYKYEPNAPGLALNSIYSRPQRFLSARGGPGAVVRGNSWGHPFADGPGVRGSIEGPPFVGEVYKMSSDKMDDEKDGSTNKGTWKCVSKVGALTTMTTVDGSATGTIGGPDKSGFEYPHLQDYIFKKVSAGGRRVSRSRKGRRSSVRRRGTSSVKR